MPRSLAVLLSALAVLLAVPAAHAEVVTETVTVPTVDGAEISVDILRDTAFDAERQPIVLTYSPYNVLNEDGSGFVAHDDLGLVEQGYARAVADVLGTHNSTGCWDYGGPKEQQSGVDLVNALARLPWSNGKVAMVGGSYDGTTANMVAVRGADVPGLAAIVPQAAISRWYGYAYQDGVRYFLNSDSPTDEGFDTPLGFDFGLARTPPTKPDVANVADLPTGRYNPCDSVEHTQRGYDTTPDYDGFWLGRDYLKDAAEVRVPVLVTHGWQDYNVKQSEGLDFYAAAVNAPLRMLYMSQGRHGVPGGPYPALLERFLEHTLKGVDNGIADEPPVRSFTRTGETAAKTASQYRSWPPPGTHPLTLALGREGEAGVLAPGARGDDAPFTDTASSSEERALAEGPESEDGWRYYASAPLRSTLRIAGSPVLDARLTASQPFGQLSPTLLDVAPDGSATVISRGHLNLQYRGGLDHAVPVPVGEPVRARVRLAPQDQTVPAGHRLGLIVAGSNVVWALPDRPGVEISLQHGASTLQLPAAG